MLDETRATYSFRHGRSVVAQVSGGACPRECDARHVGDVTRITDASSKLSAGWWWGQDSNLCTPSGGRFYRPLPLTTRPPHLGASEFYGMGFGGGITP